MKKSLYAIAALALVLLGCSKKEFNETFAPGDVVTVRAQVNDTYTKVAADNAGTFSWQDGDKITILNNENAPFEFATVKGGTDAAFTSTSFSGELGTIAYYPASASHTNTVFNLASEFEWVENASNMPMIGTVNTSEKKVSFKTAGAAIKLVCFNVPGTARKLVVSSDSKKLSGKFTPTGDPGDPKAIVSEDSASEKTITITFDSPSSTMVFYIPVPTGNLGKLTFVMKDGTDANVSTPQETKGEITMTRQHMVAAPALNCDGGTVLWSEDWSDYSKDDLPSAKTDRKGYGDVSITYTESNGLGTSPGTTKIYTENTAGGVSPELLVGKKGTGTGAAGGTFKASGIPTNGEATLILKYKTNAQTLSLSTSTDGVSFSPTSTNTKEEHVITITNSKGASTFDITFTATTTNNVRLDDILLTTPPAAFTAPSLTVAKATFAIGAAGGSDNTTFTLSNPIDGAAVAAVVETGVTWLTASITGNTLTVSAEENTGGARSAKVTLRATGVSKELTVNQAGAVAPTTVTLSISDYATANSWENGTAYTTVNIDAKITATGSTGGNNSKYYSSNNSWRFYEGDSGSVTISAAAGTTINTITFTYANGNSGVIKFGGVNKTSGTVIDVYSNSAEFTVGHSSGTKNGNVQITEIEVEYQ